MTANSKPAMPLDLAQFEGHTPGPWKDRIATGTADHMIRGNGASVCVIPFKYGTTEQRNRNARLILAAPALLAECKRQREQIAKLQEENDTLATGNLKVQVAAGKRNRALENALRPIVERLEWNGRRQGWDIRADLPAGSVEQARAALAAADKGVA